ncbi:MAG: imidazolonepropionase [Nitriliruptorales bacterium]|nr:imidazolonepropionase [Nitriliruptorales bacterium]
MLITGIGRLVTNDHELGPGLLGVVDGAAVVVDGDRVAWVGRSNAVPEAAGTRRLDVGGRCVLPGFVDAHTHLVFAGHRAAEFEARMAGATYDGGGITDTVERTRAASTEELTEGARRLAREALRSGTTTLEAKSGYGLTTHDERRLLDVAAAVESTDTPAIVRTFLGAHVVPLEFAGDADAYLQVVTGEMLDACAPLAQWCDVFCEPSVFDEPDARRVLTAGRERGLGLRLHANQLAHGPGAQLAAELGAASADHLTHLDDRDITALAERAVVATLLPAAEFSTRSPYAPARRLLDAGVEVALATDCNPGTSYTTSMPFVITLACTQLGLSPDEAVRAATVGGAAALRLYDAGRIAPGSRADLVVLDAPQPVHLAYRPGVDLINSVVRAGRVVHRKERRG